MPYLLLLFLSLWFNILMAQDFPSSTKKLNHYYKNNQYDSALVYYEKALELIPDSLKNDPELFTKLLLLSADCYEKIKDVQSAISTLEEALPIAQKINVSSNQLLITTSRNLARLYNKVGKTENAQALYKQALTLIHEDSLNYAITSHDLAILYYKQDNNQVTDSLLSIIIQKDQWYKMPRFEKYLENILTIYKNMNKPERLEQIYQRKNQGTSSKSGLEYIEQLKNQINLQKQKENYIQVDSLYQELIQILEESQAADSSKLGEAIFNLAYLKHYQLKEILSADSLYKKAKKILERVYPPKHPQLGDILYQQGILYYEQKDWRKAINTFEKAKKIRIRNLDSLSLANTLQNLAELNRTIKNYQKADNYYRQALAIYANYAKNTKIQYRTTSERYAQLLIKRRAFQSADSLLTQIINLYTDEEKQSTSYLETLFYQARSAHLNQRWETAIRRYQEVLQLSTQVNIEGSRVYSEALLKLMDLYLSQGNTKEVEKLYQKTQQNLGKDTNWEKYLITLINLSNRYFNQGFFTKAEEGYQQALSIWKENASNLPLIKAEILKNLGILKGTLSLYEEAQGYFQNALTIYKKDSENQDAYASTLVYLAQVYRQTEYINKVEPLLQEALSIQENILGGQHPDYLYTLGELGSYYQAIGQMNQAQDFFQKRLNLIADSLGRVHPSYAQALAKLANIFAYNPSQDAKTQEMLEEVTLIYKENFGEQSLEYAQALNDLTRFYNQLGRRSQDASWHQKALELYPQINQITKTYYGEKSVTYAINLLNLAVFYEYGQKFKLAERNYQQALEIIEKQLSPKHPKYFAAINNLALFYEKQGRYKEAAPLYLEAIENTLNLIRDNFPSFSELEKRSFYALNKPYFDNFLVFVANLHAQQETLDSSIDLAKILGKAYDLQLATKAMILNASYKIRNEIQKTQDQNLKAKYEQWKYTRDIISKYYTSEAYTNTQNLIKLDSLEKLAQRLEKDIAQSLSSFQDEHPEELPHWQMIQQNLQAGELAIEMIQLNTANEDSIYVALILSPETTSQPKLVSLKNAQELDGKFFKRYRNYIRAQKTDALSYQKYWQPLKDKLNEMYPDSTSPIKRIYFSPDGVYHLINLHTLYNRKNSRYLIDELEIIRLSNTKDLIRSAETDTLPRPNTRALLMGRPTYKIGEAQFQGWLKGPILDLPGTEIEVKKIEAILKANQWENQTFLKLEATEENIKNINSPYVLHVATHGFFVEVPPPLSIPDTRLNPEKLISDWDFDGEDYVGRNPNAVTQRSLETYYKRSVDAMLRSGIILAGVNNYAQSSTNDGILTAYEAGSLNLDSTNLVVLSACETGAGQIQNGEGVYGLQRAILVAGAKSLLMSLWPVDDRATQKLMVAFYQEWLNGKSKREAFKAAQLKVRRETKYPYYWGGFVMVGE